MVGYEMCRRAENPMGPAIVWKSETWNNKAGSVFVHGTGVAVGAFDVPLAVAFVEEPKLSSSSLPVELDLLACPFSFPFPFPSACPFPFVTSEPFVIPFRFPPVLVSPSFVTPVPLVSKSGTGGRN